MNITESGDLIRFLRWLGANPLGRSNDPDDRPVTDDEAAAALARLAGRAGKAIQMTITVADAEAAFDRLLDRLTAADSDGAAQAVCQALVDHQAHGGAIPWPGICRPLEGWQAIQERMAATGDDASCVEEDE